jgi:alcohol dehydrogenase class IV
MNAIAHAVEALYAKDRNPVVSLMAAEAIAKLGKALPLIVEDEANHHARSDALYGAWMCGMCLGSVGMSLHHKLCHTIGGMLNLPHAETHAVVLPYALAFNAVAAPSADTTVGAALGAKSGAPALRALGERLGAPTSLRDLGVAERALDPLAEEAMRNPYWNPRPFDKADIVRLLRAALDGAPVQEAA